MKSRLFLIILLLYGYSIFFSHKTMSYAKEIRNPDFAYTGLLRPQPSKDIPRVLNEIQINDLTSTTDLLYQLQYLPNVQITSYGNPAYANFVSLNRENPKNTLFMLNGVPLNSPLNGSFNLNNIGTNNIAKFEIIRSPASSLYGTNAGAGAINLLSKEYGKTISLSTEYQTPNSLFYKIGHHSNIGNLSSNLESSLFTNTIDSSNLNGDFNITLSESTDMELFGYLYSSKGYGLKNEGGTAVLSTNFSWDDTYFLSIIPYTLIESGINQQDYHTSRIGTQIKYDIDLGGLISFSTGADLHEDKAKGSTFNEQKAMVQSIFSGTTINYLGFFVITLYLRYDHHSIAGGTFNPGTNILYRLSDELALRASINSGTAMPNLAELKVNSNLPIEKIWEATTGFDYSFSEKTNLRTTCFYNEARNATTTDSNFLIRPEEISSIDTIDLITKFGIELELSIELFKSLTSYYNYSYISLEKNLTNLFNIGFIFLTPLNQTIDFKIQYYDLNKKFDIAGKLSQKITSEIDIYFLTKNLNYYTLPISNNTFELNEYRTYNTGLSLKF